MLTSVSSQMKSIRYPVNQKYSILFWMYVSGSGSNTWKLLLRITDNFNINEGGWRGIPLRIKWY